MQHYYHDGQSEFGPMDRDTFKSLVNDGVIQDETMVYREDMDDWLSFTAFKRAVKSKKKGGRASSAGAKAAANVAKRRQQERLEEQEASPGGSGSVAGGILMMVGAIIWFVVGYMAGYIYFYPPILFVLGLISMIKGFMK